MSISFRGLVKVVLISCFRRGGCKTAKFILTYSTQRQRGSYLCGNFLRTQRSWMLHSKWFSAWHKVNSHTLPHVRPFGLAATLIIPPPPQLNMFRRRWCMPSALPVSQRITDPETEREKLYYLNQIYHFVIKLEATSRKTRRIWRRVCAEEGIECDTGCGCDGHAPSWFSEELNPVREVTYVFVHTSHTLANVL